MILDFPNPAPRLLVIGDLMIDHYLWGSCNRISPEAPVQVIDVERESYSLGGAGNVVNNLRALGAEVVVASVIGKDANGELLQTLLQQAGAEASLIITSDKRRTSCKSRLMAANQQVVRYDSETKSPISREEETQLLTQLLPQLARFDVVLLSDYGKGVLTETICQQVIHTCRLHGIKVLIDPKGTDYSKYKGAYLITPNRKEAAAATGLSLHNNEQLLLAGQQLKHSLALSYVVITLSEAGMAYFDEQMHLIPTQAKDVYDVTGAGDTVLAALGFALANEKSLAEACHFANYAAAVVVAKVGSATATIGEIETFIAATGKAEGSEIFIKSWQEIDRLVQQLKKSGKKIVFTNGCFDILHLGHVKYLEKARSFGDVLIVGLNTDASVRRLKGMQRPVNPEFDRAYLLAALSAVDYVVLFDQDTPYELIRLIQPDVLVKGGDYADKEVVGSDIAREVRLVEFVPGKSTTLVIEKMRQSR
ncbi:MAG: D-glycero-beta-D-manno-heptose-7-phosphate kinase [Cytophagales bacterium]|nr:D-glycero-beta-D-manno-heptose-7-phosphate kinase [Cytophagales bacterium]